MKIMMMPRNCACGERFVMLDYSVFSATMRCRRCRLDMLCIMHSDFQAFIGLRKSSRKACARLEHGSPRDYRAGQYLEQILWEGLLPSPIAALEFGIDSPRHLRALQYAVRRGVSAYELNWVLGDGPAITGLVRSVPAPPYPGITFVTPYDAGDFGFRQRRLQVM